MFCLAEANEIESHEGAKGKGGRHVMVVLPCAFFWFRSPPQMYIKIVLGGNLRSMSNIELGGRLTDDRAFAMPLSKSRSRLKA